MAKTSPTHRRGVWIREVANQLGLRDWTIIMCGEPTVGDDSASIRCVYGRKVAEIRLAYNFDDKPAEDRRHTVTHELLHCHLNPIRLVLANVETNLGEGVYGVTQAHLLDAIEYATDGLADVIAPHVPLPPSDRATKKKGTS